MLQIYKNWLYFTIVNNLQILIIKNNLRMKKTILMLAVTMITIIQMSAKSHQPSESVSLEEAKPYLNEFQKQVTIPEGYLFHSVNKVQTDGVPAYLFRFNKPENNEPNGEHFSFIISEKEKVILGYTHMDKKYNNLKMISKSEAERIAIKFLSNIDKSLANDLKNLWTERHDEEIIVNGKKLVIAGMKYKCYRASQKDYVWVIIGYDGSVITFERDIKWNTITHKRITQKWLHDSWITDHKINLQSSDKEKLKSIVEVSFLNGILNKLNTEDIDKGFHPDFAIQVPNGEQLNKLELTTWKQVVKDYKNSPEKMKSGDRNVDYNFELIDITGNAAVVKIRLIRNKQIITTDYISFLKFNNEWKAISKISNEHIHNPFNL